MRICTDMSAFAFDPFSWRMPLVSHISLSTYPCSLCLLSLEMDQMEGLFGRLYIITSKSGLQGQHYLLFVCDLKEHNLFHLFLSLQFPS